jgi:hypothetical protein
MAHLLLAPVTASVTELKRDPMGTRKDFYFAFSEGKSGFLCRKNLSSVVPKKNFEKKTNSSCRIFCKRE